MYRKGADWSDDAVVLAEGRKYNSRHGFKLNSASAYRVARERGLLDLLYPNKQQKYTSDEMLVEIGGQYRSRRAFSLGKARAYYLARQRNLLGLIGFPENNAPSDNNAIYIWRAIGQHYNGNPVYKIGVTSSRLGVWRIVDVAGRAGFEFDLICCEAVQGKATDLERKLHLLGEDPQLAGFNGATEFRALSDSALYAAVSMICNQL